eukprot:14812077-Alexandrium_andersonii.AAC.1
MPRPSNNSSDRMPMASRDEHANPATCYVGNPRLDMGTLPHCEMRGWREHTNTWKLHTATNCNTSKGAAGPSSCKASCRRCQQQAPRTSEYSGPEDSKLRSEWGGLASS